MTSNKKQDLDPNTVYRKFVDRLIPILGDDITFGDSIDWIGRTLFEDRWGGVFMRDEEYPTDSYCVVNMDSKGGRGSHWIAVGAGMQYDSFGRRDALRNGELLDTASDAEQSLAEYNCGVRALAWLCTLNLLGVEKAAQI